MGHHDLLSSKNLIWLVVIAIVIAVIVIILMRHHDRDDLNGDGVHDFEDDLHVSRRQRRWILIGLAIAVGVIVLYALWYYGKLTVESDYHGKHHSASIGHGGSRREASLRSQSARGPRTPSRAPSRAPSRGAASPFLTNEERSASLRSPARGSLSSLSTEGL